MEAKAVGKAKGGGKGRGGKGVNAGPPATRVNAPPMLAEAGIDNQRDLAVSVAAPDSATPAAKRRAAACRRYAESLSWYRLAVVVPQGAEMKCGWLVGIVACLPLSVSAQVLRCDIASKYRCDPSGGCQPVATSIWNIIDFPKQTIARCDAKGCDTYPAQFAVSGNFINIALPQNGVLAKISSDGSSFMEAATLTGTALVSFGSCRAN